MSEIHVGSSGPKKYSGIYAKLTGHSPEVLHLTGPYRDFGGTVC